MQVDVPRWMARKAFIYGESLQVAISRDDLNERHSVSNSVPDQAAETCGIQVLDPALYLCSETQCNGSRNDRPLYYDVHFLSEFGNKYLVSLFATLFWAQL